MTVTGGSVFRIHCSRLTDRCCRTSGNKERGHGVWSNETITGLSQRFRLAERHKYTGTYTRIIKFYCTSESGARLLDKDWLNYCLMIKDFTAFTSHRLTHPASSHLLCPLLRCLPPTHRQRNKASEPLPINDFTLISGC